VTWCGVSVSVCVMAWCVCLCLCLSLCLCLFVSWRGVCVDWPNYDAESDSETSSETEVIVTGGSGPLNQSDLGGLVVEPSSQWHTHSSPSTIPATTTSISSSQTAQKIMHLLDEIGTSNLVDRPPYYGTHFIHCLHCSGRIIDL